MRTGFSLPHAFSIGSVRAQAPAASGVYGITNRTEWIYIGEADNIRERLIELLSDDRGSDIQSHAPTGFAFELCDRPARAGRQDRLVQQYEPICNRRPDRCGPRRAQ